MQDNLSAVKLVFHPVLEMVFCMQRLGSNEKIRVIVEEYNIRVDEEMETWIHKVLLKMDPQKKELLDLYFGNDYFGMGLAILFNNDEMIENYDQFFELLKTVPAKELSDCLLIAAGFEGQLTHEIIEKYRRENRIFEMVEECFSVSDSSKWMVYKIISRPEIVKGEIIELVEYFYTRFYKNKSKKVSAFTRQYMSVHGKKLKRAYLNSISQLMSESCLGEFWKDSQDIEVFVSYFTEIGSYITMDRSRQIIGYRYPEFAEIITSQNTDLTTHSELFGVLSDPTRWKILMEIKKGPKYLTQIAGIFNMSNPAAKYHFNKLMSVGLIEVDRTDNRIYYKINEETIKKLIHNMQERFDI